VKADLFGLHFFNFMPRVKTYQKEVVLEKAMELFWQKGFHATSMQDIVSYLGISRAAIYDNFTNKEGLFHAAFSHYREVNTQRISIFLAKQSDVKEGFRSLLNNALNHSITDPNRKGCFVVNTTTELIPGDDQMKVILHENKTMYIDLFNDFIKRFKPNNGKEYKDLAALFYTFYNGLQVIAKIEKSPEVLKQSIEELLKVLD
jgi:TetR/AcrR family transcriptional repressor of nem operon